jgi:hypothetical protein
MWREMRNGWAVEASCEKDGEVGRLDYPDLSLVIRPFPPQLMHGAG